jgi:hypothetical protein
MRTVKKTETEAERIARMELRERFILRKRRRLIASGRMGWNAPAGTEWNHPRTHADLRDPAVKDPDKVAKEIDRWERERNREPQADDDPADGFREWARARFISQLLASGVEDPGRMTNWMGHRVGPARGFDIFGNRLK